MERLVFLACVSESELEQTWAAGSGPFLAIAPCSEGAETCYVHEVHHLL